MHPTSNDPQAQAHPRPGPGVPATDPRTPDPGSDPAPTPRVDPGETSSVEAAFAVMFSEFGAESTRELLAAFLTDLPSRLREFRRLAQEGDRRKLARAVHSLAGSCSIFGLEGLRARCLEIEAELKERPETDADTRLDELEARVRTARAQLDHYARGPN